MSCGISTGSLLTGKPGPRSEPPFPLGSSPTVTCLLHVCSFTAPQLLPGASASTSGRERSFSTCPCFTLVPPVFISQVLWASQDLFWVMNSTSETSVSSPGPWGVWALAAVHLISDGAAPVLGSYVSQALAAAARSWSDLLGTFQKSCWGECSGFSMVWCGKFWLVILSYTPAHP